MVKKIIPLKSSVIWTIGTTANPTTTNTTGDTVTVKITNAEEVAPTPITIGTASGAAAGTNIAVTLDFATANVAAGLWELEAVADVGEVNPKVLIPNETTGFPYLIRIIDPQSY